MRLPTYSKYKPSGVEWLGEVPEHWSVTRLRRHAQRIQTGSTPPTVEAEYYENGTVPWHGPGSFDDQIVLTKPVKMLHWLAVENRAVRMFRSGSTMVVTIGATIGKVSSLLQGGCCNQQITAIEFDKRSVHPRFATYQIKQLENTLRAIAPRATLPILDQDGIGDLSLALPELEEQHAVADFLDRQTTKIATLVAKKRTLIERLKEKRTALISRTITRGLPPDAACAAGIGPHRKLKATSIDWLGKVPEHWDVKPLGRLVRFTGGATPDKGKSEYWDGDIPWVSPKDMKRMRIDDVPDHVSTVGLTSSALTLMPEQSVLIVVRGMILAHSFPVAITDSPVTINQDMKGLTPGKQLNAEFLLWLLTGIARVFVSLADESAHGTRKLESEVVARVCVALPSTGEQDLIVDFLERETARIDTLVAKIETAIKRLQEYRVAMTTAAVTGKIDIRGTVAAEEGAA